MSLDKEFFGFIALSFSIIAFVPYIWSTVKGKTKPHLFTWIIWTIVAGVVASAQFIKGAGPGGWATILCTGIYFSIAILSIRMGERTITKSDWFAFMGALTAIPLWWVTDDPMWSVILVTIIDSLGFYPTFRKSYSKPHQELAFMYAADASQYALALLAMKNYSITTVLYPLSVFATNGSFIVMLLWRRRVLSNQK